MSDLQQATKRLRAWIANPIQCKTGSEFGDCLELAKAYLAEHRADDGEVIDSTWLNTIGWNKHEDGSYKQGVYFIVIDNGQWILMLKSGSVLFCLAHLQTRGQLRQLCRALGVEIKEKTE